MICIFSSRSSVETLPASGLLLDERLASQAIVGGGFVIVGVMLASLPERFVRQFSGGAEKRSA